MIHHSDPFATPEHARSPVRRLRGRLPAAVSLWTAEGPAGLTVSSTLVADGDPGRVLGVVDEESELWAAISATLASRAASSVVAERFAVTPLTPADRQLADRFAGLMPAPGGLFRGYEWTETPYGPVPAGHGTWAGCKVDTARRFGWGLLVEATIEHIQLGEDQPPLVHYRGRYRELA